LSEWVLITVVGIYFLAGLIKGTVGIGFPTSSIAMTAMVTDARTAVAYAVIPMCLLNAWQIYRSGNLLGVLRRNWQLIATMTFSLGFFSLLAADVPIKQLTVILGVVIALFAVVTLWRTPPELPQRFDKLAQIVTGFVCGVIGGLAGLWAPPIILYLSARRVSALEFVQTVGVFLFAGSLVLFWGYWKTNIVNSSNALTSIMLLIPALLGFSAGEILRKYLSNEMFHKIMLVIFLFLGLNIIRNGLHMA